MRGVKLCNHKPVIKRSRRLNWLLEVTLTLEHILLYFQVFTGHLFTFWVRVSILYVKGIHGVKCLFKTAFALDTMTYQKVCCSF